MGCGYLTHSCRLRTRVLVSWPRLSVRPHAEEWDSRRLTNLLRPSMSYLVRAFHSAYASKLKQDGGRGAYIQDVARVKDAWWHWTGSPAHNEWFRVQERPISGWRLEPFGVAHGIGRREVKVVGDHHSASVSRNDVMWLWRQLSRVGKVVHPAGLNLFEKPCPRLWTTWRQMPEMLTSASKSKDSF
jgi:hypothetical protein